jgi:hypothetical protein
MPTSYRPVSTTPNPSPAALPLERREFGRRTTCLHGWVLIEGRPRIACVVRNVSEGGALIECRVPKELPFQFQLSIDCKGFEATCEIRHKGATWIGVQFVSLVRFEQPIASWSPLTEDAWAGTSKTSARPMPQSPKRLGGRDD